MKTEQQIAAEDGWKLFLEYKDRFGYNVNAEVNFPEGIGSQENLDKFARRIFMDGYMHARGFGWKDEIPIRSF